MAPNFLNFFKIHNLYTAYTSLISSNDLGRWKFKQKHGDATICSTLKKYPSTKSKCFQSERDEVNNLTICDCSQQKLSNKNMYLFAPNSMLNNNKSPYNNSRTQLSSHCEKTNIYSFLNNKSFYNLENYSSKYNTDELNEANQVYKYSYDTNAYQCHNPIYIQDTFKTQKDEMISSYCQPKLNPKKIPFSTNKHKTTNYPKNNDNCQINQHHDNIHKSDHKNTNNNTEYAAPTVKLSTNAKIEPSEQRKLTFTNNVNAKTLDQDISSKLRKPEFGVSLEQFWDSIYERETNLSRFNKKLWTFITEPVNSYNLIKHELNIPIQRSTSLQQINDTILSNSNKIELNQIESINEQVNNLNLYHNTIEHNSPEKLLGNTLQSNVYRVKMCSSDSTTASATEDVIFSNAQKQMRDNVVQWMNHVVTSMHWKRSTFFVGVHALDSYLSQILDENWLLPFSSSSEYMQIRGKTNKKSMYDINEIEKLLPLISTACLFLGVSVEEEHTQIYRIRSFIKEVPTLISIRQVFIQQLNILTCLKSGLLVTRTPEDFLYYYLASLKHTENLNFRTLYNSLYETKTSENITLMEIIFDSILALTTSFYLTGCYIQQQSSAIVAVCLTCVMGIYFENKLTNQVQLLLDFSESIFQFHPSAKLILFFKQYHNIILKRLQQLSNHSPNIQTLCYAVSRFQLTREIYDNFASCDINDNLAHNLTESCYERASYFNRQAPLNYNNNKLYHKQNKFNLSSKSLSQIYTKPKHQFGTVVKPVNCNYPLFGNKHLS